jgi:hypothetical protein
MPVQAHVTVAAERLVPFTSHALDVPAPLESVEIGN